MNSNYVLQKAEKTTCPTCRNTVDLLCHRTKDISHRIAFYICFTCKTVAQVGVSPVNRES